jgi:hypothetical protein
VWGAGYQAGREREVYSSGSHRRSRSRSPRRRPSSPDGGGAGGGGGGGGRGDTAMEKLRIVTLLARRNRKWSLNDGRIPSPNVVRVAPVSGYHRVEENRRASRNSLRERSPTRNPLRYDSPLSHRCTPAGPPATVGDSDRRRRSPPPRERGERHHQRSPPPRHHGRSPPRRQRSPSPRGSGGGGGGERTKVNPKTGTAGTYQGCWEALCGTGRALPVPVSDNWPV